MSNEEIKYEKCNRCKCHRLPEDFLNEKGRKLKTCIKCRDIQKKYRNKPNVILRKAKWFQNFKKTHEEKYRKQYEISNAKRNQAKLEWQKNNKCKHGKRKTYCIECNGGSICIHRKLKFCCKICDPIGHLKGIVSSAVNCRFKKNKSKSSIKYLGTTIKEYKKYLESKFKEGMTWENYGMWEIDHITPIRYKAGGKAPDLEEVIKRLHYTNTQPLWATENRSKGNRFIG
eukprot:jgi/Bigna1/41588/e_gw1.54.15.1